MAKESGHSSGIVLRDVEPADVSVFFEHQLDPEASTMAAFPSRDREAHEEHWAKILADPTVIAKTIVAGGEVAGNVASWMREDKRLVGYWIDKSQWGKGIASRALAEFVREVEDRPLYAYVARLNTGSIRVLQKCGFRISEEEAHSQPPDDGVEELLMKLPGPIGEPLSL
jgi:RimJ/RimL family protein N-acetyltransferase